MKKDKDDLSEVIVVEQPIVVDTIKKPVNPGYVRLQNLQSVEQTIPLTDGGSPLCLTPARGKGNISRPVLRKDLPTAFVERLIKEKKIKQLSD